MKVMREARLTEHLDIVVRGEVMIKFHQGALSLIICNRAFWNLAPCTQLLEAFADQSMIDRAPFGPHALYASRRRE